MDSRATALLVTVDVEIAHDRDLACQEQALFNLTEALAHAPTTFFTTADAAEAFRAPLAALAAQGHEIGCHGFDHREDYRTVSEAEARRLLSESTDRIEAATGVRPRVFRGPRMTTSAATQAVLRELGYIADLSPCSWRLDPFASSAYEVAWARLGPAPYVPAPGAPFLPAGTPPDRFTAVPLSGFLLPLVSGTLFILRTPATRLFARALARMARARRAPLVYLFHSYEFVDISDAADNRPFHHRLYLHPGRRREASNSAFIRFLHERLGLRPLTASAYAAELWRATDSPAVDVEVRTGSLRSSGSPGAS